MFRYSGEDERNPDVEDWSEHYLGRDNVEFFSDAFAALAGRHDIGNQGLMAIGLVGQRDLPGFTIRTAQAILRWDLRPSLWSHLFLVAEPVQPDAASVADARIREVPIYSRAGRFPEPNDNAVMDGRLALYGDPRIDANVAVLAVEMSHEEAAGVAERALEKLNLDRMRYDLWESLGMWQSYLWGAGTRPNPLREGFPVAASAFVEYCFEAIQVDLSPGGSERNSAPEHVWNGAVWWNHVFREFHHRVAGFYVLRDKGCSLMDPNALAPRETTKEGA
jgi:hypothetical protein